MKKRWVVIAAISAGVLLAALLVFVVIPEAGYQNVRKMQIRTVDLNAIADGVYHGEFAYAHSTIRADITIKNHVIERIDLDHDGTSEQAIAAEGVVDEILAQQTIDVDAVSGATTTSKAILKAVENALLHA